jgi:hypothetical protein
MSYPSNLTHLSPNLGENQIHHGGVEILHLVYALHAHADFPVNESHDRNRVDVIASNAGLGRKRALFFSNGFFLS